MHFKFFLFFLPLTVIATPGFFEPWGKDADISLKKETIEITKTLSPLAVGMNSAIDFHQKFISPADGPRSHFKPSSSTYMRLAIYKHGFFKGFIMGCDRLMRENGDKWIYRTTLINEEEWKIDDP